MSHEAVDWASLQRSLRPAERLTLWSLADAVKRGTDTAFPSNAAIMDFTGLDRKTVIASLAALAAAKLIEDTRLRVGRTMQVKVWRLAFKASQKRDASPEWKCAGNGTLATNRSVPKTGHGTSPIE